MLDRILNTPPYPIDFLILNVATTRLKISTDNTQLLHKLFNPFMHNVAKWPNILLKYVWPFYNIMHERVKYLGIV